MTANLKPTAMNGSWNTSFKGRRIDCLYKKSLTRNGIWQFDKSAQIKDTSLQISDMKILFLKMGDISRNSIYPRTHKVVRKSNPEDTADKQTHMRKARTAQHMAKKCMKCQKFDHFSSVCKSKGPTNSKKGNVIISHQGIQRTSVA